jgi:pyridinium-3,5-bisthiocarboxylic acid mononucleotide nickel chelatase
LEKSGLILLVQLDHLSGEDLGWALKALDHPGIRNRNLIPVLTKKGRMGYLLLLDIDPEAEGEIAQYLLDSFTTNGYHRIETRHVHRQTVTRSVKILVTKGGRELTGHVRLKRDKRYAQGPYFVESDDLFELHQRITDELDATVFPWEIRRRLETMAAESTGDTLILSL